MGRHAFKQNTLKTLVLGQGGNMPIIGGDMLKYIESFIMRKLPHGSGIDCDWIGDRKSIHPKNFVFRNSFHCMNEHGTYVGYQDFALIIPIRDWQRWRLVFTGYRRQEYIYTLRDYLEDLFAHEIAHIETIFIELLEREE